MSTTEVPVHEKLINAFLRIYRAVHLYTDNNQVVVQACYEFKQVLSQSTQQAEVVSLQISDERLYFCGKHLRLGAQAAGNAQKISEYLTQREVFGINWHPETADVPPEQLVTFFRILHRAGDQESPLAWIRQELSDKSMAWVFVESKQDLKTSPVARLINQDNDTSGTDSAAASLKSSSGKEASKAKLWQKGRQSYARALFILKTIADKIRADKPAGIAKAMRQIQQIVDLIMADDEIMLGLSTLRDHDDYTYVHSLNVSILAITMGHFIGLSKHHLSILGICALFHDLGKVKTPLEILNKPGKLDGREWKIMEKHSLESVFEILKLKAPSEIKARILLPPFEHHLKYDLSGYPKFHRRKQVSLFGRILTIVDVYDAITSPRVYRKSSISPDEALDLMLASAGKDFDPLLLKAFINLMGVYPVGTLVRMDSGEIGLVARRPRSQFLDRPQVRILIGNGSGDFKVEKTVDLTERNGHPGSFRRTIVESFHPGQLGIQPAAYLS